MMLISFISSCKKFIISVFQKWRFLSGCDQVSSIYHWQRTAVADVQAQSAIYQIVNAFCTLVGAHHHHVYSRRNLAIYSSEKQPSIMLTEWYQNLPMLNDHELMNEDFWQKIRLVRDAVNKVIEGGVTAGKIGSALGSRSHPVLWQQHQTDAGCIAGRVAFLC